MSRIPSGAALAALLLIACGGGAAPTGSNNGPAPVASVVVTLTSASVTVGSGTTAAVVLRDGQSATERELRDFAATRLADFKVPRRILLLPEIPKGATGKLQRIGLAEKLGLVPARSAAS